MLPVALGCLPDTADVIVVDGAYRSFPHTKPYSTDGTLDIARAWGARVVAVSKAWPDQIAKRTFCLGLAPVVLVLDADEILYGPLPTLPADADVGWVWLRSPIYDAPYAEPRLFRVGPGWHYDKRHHWIYDGQGGLVCSHTKPGPGYRHVQLATVIDNMRNWRSGDRNRCKHEYAIERNKEELRHREEGA